MKILKSRNQWESRKHFESALKNEEKNLVKEEQQEEAKKALQEQFAPLRKNTPGAVTWNSKRKVAIKAAEKEDREKMERTKEAIGPLKSRNGDRQAEEKAMEAPNRSWMATMRNILPRW